MSDNIKVVVKVRPLISREIEGKLSYQWRVKNDTLYQLDDNGRDFGSSFTFDKVYGDETKTSDVFQDVAKPIVEAATAGFNGTIFAYGQTSSGKTYTMSGTEDSPGIIPLAVYNLFEIIKNIPNRDFLVRVSYMEIYNEQLKDLLDVKKTNIKVHESLQGVKVDAKEYVTTSPEEVLKYLKEGEANRQTGATNMNEISSRSHSIFQITIESREHVEGELEAAGCVNVSQLNLVDLAGSERAGQTGATGLRFKEGTHINKSLSALALVIKQLSEDPNKFINYRDSKLTRILQNSLGGNAKTSIICAITPAAIEETISTLQFANRAKAIKNKPEVNAVATDATMIQSLTKQLSKLQSQLESKRNLEVMLESKKNAEVTLQKQIAALQKLILNGFGQRSSAEIVGNRRKNAQLRRVTISTLHSIEEDPAPSIPKFCTPSLKYNSMLMPGAPDFNVIQDESKLSSVPEETRMVTPPPTDKRVNFNDEVINLDSDDETEVTCSPYHKCYVATKTPPCVLRIKAKNAENELKEIIELTEREKMYTPSVVELLEKLEKNTNVIAQLQEEVDSLNTVSKEKDLEIDKLKVKICKSEEEMKSVLSAKMDVEALCKDYTIKLTDSEVSYETLKQKTQRREQELLSLLEEQQRVQKRAEDIGGKALSRTIDKELSHFMDMSKDISLVNSDNESSITSKNDDESSSHIQDLVVEMQTQLTKKTQTILDLESNLFAQNQKIETLELSCKELQLMLNNFKEKLSQSENENFLLKSTTETLHTTIKNQKSNLETAHTDMDSYNKLIQELNIKLREKESIADVNINESVLEKMIQNEEKFIANNENMKNIIHSFKIALDSRNKEIERLQSMQSDKCGSIDNNLKQELDKKEKQINALYEEAQNLKDQINENIKLIDQLQSEKKALLDSEHQLSENVCKLEEKHQKLEQINQENANIVQSLQATNDELTQTVSEHNEKGIELTSINENLSAQKFELEKIIRKLENYIEDKNILIESLRKEDGELQENLSKAKTTVSKLQSIISSLSGDIEEVPLIIDNFVVIFNILNSNLNILETTVANVINQKEAENDIGNQLRKELASLKEKYEQETKGLISQIQSLNSQESNLVLQNDNLQKELAQVSMELDMSRNELHNFHKQYNDLDKKIHATMKDNNNLRENINSKDEIIVSLQEKIVSINEEVSKFQQEYEHRYEDCMQQINNLILEKGCKILDLENKLQGLEKSQGKAAELTKYTQELNDAIEKRDQMMHDVLRKTWDLTNKFNIQTDISKDNNNIYNQILSALDSLTFNLAAMNTKTGLEHDDIDKHLAEAKQELMSLSHQNLSLKENVSTLESKNEELIAELEVIKTNYNNIQQDLMQGNQLIESLRNELKNKLIEIEANESKVLELKEKVGLLDITTKQKIKALQQENEQLLLKCQSLEVISCRHNKIDNSDCENVESNSSNVARKSICNVFETNEYKPPSLVTICCKRLEECIQPSDKHIASSDSDASIGSVDKATQTIICHCERLILELAASKKYNVDLSNTIEKLLAEQEEVRNEVQLLLEPSNELQKKIVNHRTNLSTLTATTYAENKSLKSQVTALQHHHTRFHMLCQRDIPAVKKQLSELMAILKKDSSLIDKANISFKRFSLPDTLENNCTIASFKNDETTLDGDLLMLDTNVTLATSADNTLTGHDQTCLDISQAFMYNEVACQTYDAAEISELFHINSQIEILSNDLKINERLENLKEENNKLREQVDKYTRLKKSKIDAQSSPIKGNTIIESTSINDCQKCEIDKHEEITLEKELEKLKEELKSLNQELSNLKIEKDSIEDKYKNLMLEVPSTDALVCKLNILEKEKTTEHAKLMQALSIKSDEIKRLQEENDTLSTQVMENIDEADDLNKQVQTLSDANAELMKKCSELENVIEQSCKIVRNGPCPQCEVKNELTRSLVIDGTNQQHSKLNRSLSESDTSSRLNKICTLQNQLHASKQDCKELTEDVTTIKIHLERSNLSMGHSMDLDDSMGESNVFNFSRDFDVADPSNKFSMPNIPEEHVNDVYLLDKKDCLNYYLEVTGTDKENVSGDLKIIDVMKMFYNNFVSKHNSEVENLRNKLKMYEESRRELEFHVDNLKTEYSRISKEFNEKDKSFQKVVDILAQIKENINIVREEIIQHTNNGTCVVTTFKEKLLKPIDSGLGLSSANVFEQLIDSIVRKHENDLSEIMNRYVKLQEHMENVSAELTIVNENLMQMKCQLTDKENEYKLLKAQKEKVQEISNAVTLDIVMKERELSDTIRNGCQKLVESNIIRTEDIDWSMPLGNNINVLFDRFLKQYKLKNCDSDNLLLEINKSTTLLQSKEKELEMLQIQNEKLQQINNNVNLELAEKTNALETQNTLYEDLTKIYENKVQENQVNISLVAKLTEEINVLKDKVQRKQETLDSLTNEIKDYKENKTEEKEGKIQELINTVVSLEKDISGLKIVNEMITKEKEVSDAELLKSEDIIKLNKSELEKMTADILILRENVKENMTVTENLRVEAKSLLEQNLQLKQQLEEKCRDCSRLEKNIKIHEKTAEIQTKMIKRMQKQREEADKNIQKKDSKLEELTAKYTSLQKELEEVEALKIAKQSLESRIIELENELEALKRHTPNESINDVSRRRRRSLYDSQRAFADIKQDSDDHSKIEAVFGSRAKPDDLFMDVDDDSSNRSTPLRLSRGRDSLLSRVDQNEKEDEETSRPSSVQATRRRRQSTHDLHRSVAGRRPPSPRAPPHDGDQLDQSEVASLQKRLTDCQEELEELRKRYKEVDEECETCAEYLREQEAQCIQLNKEKTALEKMVAKLKDTKNINPNKSELESKKIFVDAFVNTDEDWTNLHSVVVDRMSYDAEVDKNKRLTKIIEELRFKKQELQNTLAKMQKALEKNSGTNNDRELQSTKIELEACKQELEELRERYKELDEECEICSQYLQERDEQCSKLKQAKEALEAKLEQYQEDHGVSQSTRKKRQSLHDQNRDSGTDVNEVTTETSDDFLSYQVERDDSRQTDKTQQEVKVLRLTVEKLTQQKAALEHQLMTLSASHPMYVATGSAIVQSQQITDVMKENQRLKKINAKLVTICKKRGKEKRDSEDAEQKG